MTVKKYFQTQGDVALDILPLSLQKITLAYTVYLARSCPRSTYTCQKLIDF